MLRRFFIAAISARRFAHESGFKLSVRADGGFPCRGTGWKNRRQIERKQMDKQSMKPKSQNKSSTKRARKTKVQIITTDLTGSTHWDDPYALACRGDGLEFTGWYVFGFKTKERREAEINEITRGIDVIERRVNQPVIIDGKQAFSTRWTKGGVR
ncbi:MAG TPA: hypothetical protein VFW05_13185 [Verrucomicrobiae bacterium]|nr:hypothetical protein [Verrucomicrobiae bacterium]